MNSKIYIEKKLINKKLRMNLTIKVYKIRLLLVSNSADDSDERLVYVL
jgi:hypothetical protein